MEAISTLSDKFSWRRAASLGLLFRGAIRNYILLSVTVTLLCCILVRVFIAIGGNTVTVYTLMSLIVAPFYYLSPLTFSKRDDTLMTLLPAKPIEKWLFYIVYCLIIVPCIIQGIWYGTDLLYSLITSTPTLKESLIDHYHLEGYFKTIGQNWFTIIITVIQAEVMILAVLYVNLRYQRHRVIKSLLGLIIMLIFIGLASGIAGALMAISEISSDPSIAEKPEIIIEKMWPVFIVVYALITLFMILGLWLTYRCIAKGEVKN